MDIKTNTVTVPINATSEQFAYLVPFVTKFTFIDVRKKSSVYMAHLSNGTLLRYVSSDRGLNCHHVFGTKRHEKTTLSWNYISHLESLYYNLANKYKLKTEKYDDKTFRTISVTPSNLL